MTRTERIKALVAVALLLALWLILALGGCHDPCNTSTEHPDTHKEEEL